MTTSATDYYKVDIPEGIKGRWAIQRFTVERTPLSFADMAMSRECTPGTYTRLIRYHDADSTKNGVVVMSDTPAEVRDHYGVMYQVRERGGRVLIHGLGMGMFLKYVLSLPQVEHVDVVEIDADLIALVAPHYEDPRLTVHHGDCLSFTWPKGSRWNVVWHDIWDTISADNLVDMKALHRRFGTRCDYQESWSRDWCEHYAWLEGDDNAD